MTRRRILEVFNRYAFMGGEEKIAGQIHRHLAQDHEVASCGFDSREWMGDGTPGKLGQAARLFYNRESRARFDRACAAFLPDVALFHNVFPVGSPALYHAAKAGGIPVVQMVHNFRPFSVGGSLYVNGRFTPESLAGNFWPEVRLRAWQGSLLKSLLMALALKRLHRSGWLAQVRVWVCISDFMKEKFRLAGIDESRLVTLKHAWEPMAEVPHGADDGAYLFLGRLVPEKGVEVLLTAWERLQQKMGGSTPMLWIGGEGPLEERVKLAEQRNGKVRHLGLLHGEEKAGRLRRCRALVVPSVWWEPLGLVTYEAYDYGKPVLAAASGGLAETVQEGLTGLLHCPGEAEALAASVLKLEGLDAGQRQHMGMAGRAWLLKNADVTAWKRAFDAILTKALET